MTSRAKRIGSLRPGDLVRAEDGTTARITYAAAQEGREVWPHRISAERLKVPGWYVVWIFQDGPNRGRHSGMIADPQDQVLVP